MSLTLPARVAAFLVAGHLNQHSWRDDGMSCCRMCCGPCWALGELLDAGLLDEVARPVAVEWDDGQWDAAGDRGWAMWDYRNDRVDRDKLDAMWANPHCADMHEEDA